MIRIGGSADFWKQMKHIETEENILSKTPIFLHVLKNSPKAVLYNWFDSNKFD